MLASCHLTLLLGNVTKLNIIFTHTALKKVQWVRNIAHRTVGLTSVGFRKTFETRFE